MILSD